MSSGLANKRILVPPTSSGLKAHVEQMLLSEGACLIGEPATAMQGNKRSIDGAVLLCSYDGGASKFDLRAYYDDPTGMFLALSQRGVFSQAASIVLVIGTAALRSTGDPTIAAAEAALNTFLRAFALTLASEKIRINTVMHEWAAESESQPASDRPHANEVAGSIAFFLSDASRWMTRSRLLLDRGASLKASLGV